MIALSMFALSLVLVLLTCRSAKFALPHMKRGSSIINTASVTAFKGSNKVSRLIRPLSGQLANELRSTDGGLWIYKRRYRLIHVGLPVVSCPGTVLEQHKPTGGQWLFSSTLRASEVRRMPFASVK